MSGVRTQRTNLKHGMHNSCVCCIADCMLVRLTTPKNSPSLTESKYNHMDKDKALVRIQMLYCHCSPLQVDSWHLTSRQCPAELSGDLQFTRGSYLSHSFSLFIHYSALNSGISQNKVIYCPLVEHNCHTTDCPCRPCRSFS